ncbi:venom carboxylesterase-6-like [Macrobrachium nipponense]|uniref:venom carboxylesterase-6-like n=1 Tax=Macrobrachium nipponense TaxID=159736 RepID=UPI0030C868CA
MAGIFKQLQFFEVHHGIFRHPQIMRLILILCAASALTAATFTPLEHLEEGDEKKLYDVGDLVVVEVAQGRIVGQERIQSDYIYHSFQSIPYAKPPTGERRFKDPEPSDPWEGDLNATLTPPKCPQFVVMGQEDCLFLNIYTPPDSIGRLEPLPVMFFIHGGGYYLGWSNQYSGVHSLLRHDVIVVTTNYRLGVLGFLSTEDSAAPGNLALKDQALALRWVNENIAAFGGDVGRITIFGESAGAASVHYHLLTPSSAGLFSGAIMQSGSALAPWSRGRDFKRVAEQIGGRFSCPTTSSDEMIACLQGKDAHLIDEQYAEFIEFNFQPFVFAPRVDGDYIPGEPVTLVKEGRYHHVPMMMGSNRDEGALLSQEMYWDRAIIKVLIEDFPKNGPASLELYDDEDPLNTSTAVYNYYLGGLNFEYEDLGNVTKLYTDRLFGIPVDWLTQLLDEQDEVYRWELRHRGQHSIINFLPFINRTLSDPYICHGDDLSYFFHPSIFGTPTTEEDMLVSDLYTTLWTNFAKTRNPTPDGSLGFIWEKTNRNDLKKLLIKAELPLQMETDINAIDRAFWESLPLRINDLMKA